MERLTSDAVFENRCKAAVNGGCTKDLASLLEIDLESQSE